MSPETRPLPAEVALEIVGQRIIPARARLDQLHRVSLTTVIGLSAR